MILLHDHIIVLQFIIEISITSNNGFFHRLVWLRGARGAFCFETPFGICGRSLAAFFGAVASMISGVSRLVTPRHSSNLAIFSSKSFCSAFNFFASLKFSAWLALSFLSFTSWSFACKVFNSLLSVLSPLLSVLLALVAPGFSPFLYAFSLSLWRTSKPFQPQRCLWSNYWRDQTPTWHWHLFFDPSNPPSVFQLLLLLGKGAKDPVLPSPLPTASFWPSVFSQLPPAAVSSQLASSPTTLNSFFSLHHLLHPPFFLPLQLLLWP